MYDYVIVGSGLFGATFAYEANKLGYKCLVIDRRKHIAGNIYCEKKEEINVHKYGPHIFHTDNEAVWNYVNRFAKFNNFRYSPIASSKGELFNLPFNMNTFYRLWGVITPREAKEKINAEIKEHGFNNPSNLEEQALSLVGKTLYDRLIKGYTEKQWGRSAKKIPSFVIKRIPLRYNFDNNYFNHKYQGIPEGGYNIIIENMLRGITVNLGIDYLRNKIFFDNIGKKIVYSGMIDELNDFTFGRLEYRSLEFEEEILDVENYQGVAGMNFTDSEIPFTRIVEHKHFEFGTQRKTIITREYSREWKPGDEPYYPINDKKNNRLHDKYLKLTKSNNNNMIIGGRLADYKYYDMEHVIQRAWELLEVEFDQKFPTII